MSCKPFSFSPCPPLWLGQLLHHPCQLIWINKRKGTLIHLFNSLIDLWSFFLTFLSVQMNLINVLKNAKQRWSKWYKYSSVRSKPSWIPTNRKPKWQGLSGKRILRWGLEAKASCTSWLRSRSSNFHPNTLSCVSPLAKENFSAYLLFLNSANSGVNAMKLKKI